MTTRPNDLGRASSAFTLIELLTVVLVILVLATITAGVAKYVSQRGNIAKTRILIAKLDMAIESFRQDNGYYPTTTIYRTSPVDYHAEKENSSSLYNQLMGSKRYGTFSTDETITMNNGTTFFVDAWGTPVNYFCPPSNATPAVYYTTNSLGVGYVASTNYYIPDLDNFTVGGLVNVQSYDLFSYGPDKKTSVPGNPGTKIGNNWYGWPLGWTNNATLAEDDIWAGQP